MLDELRWQARDSVAWLGALVSDVTAEQAHWQPPGRANTIAATYTHIVYNQDEDMNRGFLDCPMLSESAFRGRTGLPAEWRNDDEHAWRRDSLFDWMALRTYGSAVGEFLIQAVDRLTDTDLERFSSVSTPNRPVWTGLDVVRLSVGGHPKMHGGEIACLKGLQGANGYISELDQQRG